MSFDPEKPYNVLPLLPPKAEIEPQQRAHSTLLVPELTCVSEIDQRTLRSKIPSPLCGGELQTKATLKKAISAGRALAELKGLGETIPNQNNVSMSAT